MSDLLWWVVFLMSFYRGFHKFEDMYFKGAHTWNSLTFLIFNWTRELFWYEMYWRSLLWPLDMECMKCFTVFLNTSSNRERNCHTLICFTCPCACLHPPPGVAHLPHLSPGYLYLGFLSVPVCLVCQVNQRFSLSSCFPQSLFFLSSWLRLLPVLTLSPPAWPLCLPLTSSLPTALYRFGLCPGYELLPVPDLPFVYPLDYNKYQSSNHLPPVSASGSHHKSW
jgi:hypothetical protein